MATAEARASNPGKPETPMALTRCESAQAHNKSPLSAAASAQVGNCVKTISSVCKAVSNKGIHSFDRVPAAIDTAASAFADNNAARASPTSLGSKMASSDALETDPSDAITGRVMSSFSKARLNSPSASSCLPTELNNDPANVRREA